MGIIWYDIAALCILGICLYLYLSKSRLFITQNVFFGILIATVAVATVFDIAGVLAYAFIDTLPLALSYAINMTYHLAQNTIPSFFMLFLLSFGGLLEGRRILYGSLISIAWAASALLILSTPFTGWIFSFSAEGLYVRGPGIFWLYLSAGLHTIAGVAALIAARLRFDRATKRSLLLFIPFAVIPIFIQFIYPALLVQAFGLSLALLMMLLTIQDFGHILDNDHQLFNRGGFALQYEMVLSRSRSAHVFILMMENVNYLRSSLGLERYLELEARLVSRIFGMQQPGWYGAKIEDGCFYFLVVGVERVSLFRQRFESFVSDEGTNPASGAPVHLRSCGLQVPDDLGDFKDIFVASEALNRLDRSTARNRIVTSGALAIRDTRERHRVNRHIEKALDDGLLSLVFQPIVDAQTRKTVSAEALLRLKTDDGGPLIPPDVFIRQAEECGAMFRIGDRVLAEACRVMARVRALGLSLENMEVNLSMAECVQSFMAEKVLAHLSRAGLEPGDLVIELTETGRDSLPEALQRNMQALYNAGIGLAMDDFGPGYANMMQLMNLPFSYIKFDRSLVNEQAPGPRTRGDALSRLVTIFGQQDTCIIAEGIETEAQYRRMLALGIDRLQGYLFSKPLSEDAFIDWLAGGAS